MRDEEEEIVNSNRIGRDVLKRGMKEMVVVERERSF